MQRDVALLSHVLMGAAVVSGGIVVLLKSTAHQQTIVFQTVTNLGLQGWVTSVDQICLALMEDAAVSGAIAVRPMSFAGLGVKIIVPISQMSVLDWPISVDRICLVLMEVAAVCLDSVVLLQSIVGGDVKVTALKILQFQAQVSQWQAFKSQLMRVI